MVRGFIIIHKNGWRSVCIKFNKICGHTTSPICNRVYGVICVLLWFVWNNSACFIFRMFFNYRFMLLSRLVVLVPCLDHSKYLKRLLKICGFYYTCIWKTTNTSYLRACLLRATDTDQLLPYSSKHVCGKRGSNISNTHSNK